MTRIFTMCAVLGLAVGTARAQEAAPLTTFLEKRVPDELAVEGVMLSRRDLSLKIEQVGDQFLISLVDLSTGQVTASTKLASLPPDRDAAVAAVTHVVAALSKQGSAPPPAETRAETVTDQIAAQRYQREALRIGERYALSGIGRTATLSRYWVAYQGEQNHEVDPVTFYADVGRPDLGRMYAERISERNAAITVGSIAAAGALISMGVGIYKAVSDSNSAASCNVNQSQMDFSNCVNAGVAAGDKGSSDMKTALVPAALFAIGSVVAFGIAVHYDREAHPISEDDAMSLVDAYNHGLRHRLGMPTAEPTIKSVKLAPFTTGTRDGGLALGGTF